MRRLLDASGAVISEFAVEDDRNVINYTQDVEPVLEHTKRLNTSGRDGYWQNRAAKQFAEVPLIFAQKWAEEDGIGMNGFMRMGKREKEAYIRRKLADPDYAFMRTFWK